MSRLCIFCYRKGKIKCYPHGKLKRHVTHKHSDEDLVKEVMREQKRKKGKKTEAMQKIRRLGIRQANEITACEENPDYQKEKRNHKTIPKVVSCPTCLAYVDKKYYKNHKCLDKKPKKSIAAAPNATEKKYQKFTDKDEFLHVNQSFIDTFIKDAPTQDDIHLIIANSILIQRLGLDKWESVQGNGKTEARNKRAVSAKMRILARLFRYYKYTTQNENAKFEDMFLRDSHTDLMMAINDFGAKDTGDGAVKAGSLKKLEKPLEDAFDYLAGESLAKHDKTKEEEVVAGKKMYLIFIVMTMTMTKSVLT